MQVSKVVRYLHYCVAVLLLLRALVLL